MLAAFEQQKGGDGKNDDDVKTGTDGNGGSSKGR